MNQWQSRREQAAGPQVVRPTGMCGRSGCGGTTAIQLAQVVTPNGQRAVVAPGDAVASDWTLRSGLTFVGWIERCGYCFSVERLNEERARFRADGREHPTPNWGKPPFCHITSRQAFREAFGVSPIAQSVLAQESAA